MISKLDQMIFDIEYYENYSEASFVVNDYNKSAFEAINMVDIGYKPFANLLLIYGGRFSGKTYLCKLWQKRIGAANLNEPFHHIFHQKKTLNLNARSLDHLINKITNTDCFLENIDFFQEDQLFYILETMINSKYQYLLTTSFWPLKFRTIDLSSRLNAIKRVSILAPDLIALKTMIMKYFTIRDINVSLNTLNYITYRMPSDFEIVRVILEDINQCSLINKTNISIPFLQKFYSNSLEPRY